MAVNIDKGSALEGLSLTPLIDVVFLLLIFFLVATRFSEEEHEMDLRLAEASEAKPLTSQPQETCININSDGEYIVSGKTITVDDLYPMLRAVWVNNPGTASVVIRVDERCDWKWIATAANACKKAGLGDPPVHTRGEGG